MGWVWSDEPDGTDSTVGDVAKFANRNPSSSGERCSTRKVVKSQCKTEEVEPGKFVRQCEKTEQIFRDCVGRPVEMIQSDKEYTEEDVTDEVLKGGSLSLGSSEREPFDFPGLRSDIEAIERSFLGGLGSFFEAAEDMKNGFLNVFKDPRLFDGDSSSSPSMGRGVPVKDHPKVYSEPNKSDSGHVDLSGLARDV